MVRVIEYVREKVIVHVGSQLRRRCLVVAHGFQFL